MQKMDVFGDALATLGAEIAHAAVVQDAEAAANWEKLKTMMKLAQTLGLQDEAFEALFSPGEKMVQKKAIWYRRQKQLIKAAMELGVDLTGMTQAQAKDATDAAREKAKTPQQKEADAMRMLERSMKGAMRSTRNGKSKATKVMERLVTATGKRKTDMRH